MRGAAAENPQGGAHEPQASGDGWGAAWVPGGCVRNGVGGHAEMRSIPLGMCFYVFFCFLFFFVFFLGGGCKKQSVLPPRQEWS